MLFILLNFLNIGIPPFGLFTAELVAVTTLMFHSGILLVALFMYYLRMRLILLSLLLFNKYSKYAGRGITQTTTRELSIIYVLLSRFILDKLF